MPNNDDFFTFENLHKSYTEGERSRTVLQGAEASFAQGEFAAILGKSGSGKSTILNLISGIDTLDQGRIVLEDQELTAMDERQRTLFRRKHIGFVFQFFNLLPTLSVIENVVLPLELNGTSRKVAAQQAQGLLEAVGLPDRAATYPDRLSGGEQQRVAIARALVNDPLLVLADEPTGNLDVETGEQVLELLDSLTRQAGKNLIMVTHSRSNAAVADRVLRLLDGKLVDEDLP
ncbi:MAG: ABC transporter ATP-binding protein [Chloroflexi bacterium]|nr:MAG: ABC transporter ATP-binding protein [Chloroflexota bacterium]MBL1196421.1 ABC transporter ATP-binding protein [Chloroflexota bacterium]NOH13716.1 ABC transporter ATP-binding protein [Chloroflexota bacterium]